jgi:integrase
VDWENRQLAIPATNTKDRENRRIPFDPDGRLAEILERREPLGPNAYVFGTPNGAYQQSIRTAWESLLLVANGHATKRESHGHRVDRQTLRIIDLHWHDLRHEGACRLLADGVDLRAIQLILGHSDVKQTQRYLNVTDEELRKTLSELWQRRRNAQRGRRRMSRKHSGVRVPDRGGNSLSRAV